LKKKIENKKQLFNSLPHTTVVNYTMLIHILEVVEEQIKFHAVLHRGDQDILTSLDFELFEEMTNVARDYFEL
jgi:hypothetical protein